MYERACEHDEDFRSMAKSRIFISYKSVDIEAVNTLLAWDKDNEFEFACDNGVPGVALHSDAGKDIKLLLTEKIRQGTHLLCVVGKDTGNNDWVNWEVQQAGVTGKRLVGVRLGVKNKAPANLLIYGGVWAKQFTFDALRKAIDEPEWRAQ